MHALETSLDWLSRGLKLIAAVWIFLLSLLILTDVLARGVFNQPILGIKELVANSIVMIAFLQLPYTVLLGGMLRAEIIDIWLSPFQRRILLTITFLLGGLLFLLVAIAGWEPMLRSWASGEYEGEGGFRVPTYPVRTAIVVCGGLAAINYLLIAIKALVSGELPQGERK